MGAMDLRMDIVHTQKKYLDYCTFEGSLQPYWKVGTLIDGWRKLYELLWPMDEDPHGRTLDEKRKALTHAGLIAVLREMANAIPPVDDGAPTLQEVYEARGRYLNSIQRLVEVGGMRFVSEPFKLPLPATFDPPVPSPSAPTRPIEFLNFNLTSPHPPLGPTTSQKRRSGKSSGRSGTQPGGALVSTTASSLSGQQQQ